MEIFVGISMGLLWSISIVNLILTLVLIRLINKLPSFSKGAGSRALPIGAKAPDFRAETLSGQIVTLNSYTKLSIIFLFIGPNCGPCRTGFPKYQELALRAQRSNVSLILVSNGDTDETKAVIEEFSVTIPVLVAPKPNNFFNDYQVLGTPTFIFIDENGKVKASGHPDMEDWSKLLT
jgi:peroxiredoxin